MKDPGNKTLVIGLDGATFDIIDPLIQEGRLENLKKLIEGGVRGTLRSTIPPLSPVAWSTFATGKNAGKHGIFSFTEQKSQSYEIQFVNALSRKAKPLWMILSEAGKKTGILNVPISYPPDKVNGVMISGMDAPGIRSEFTHPPQLKKEILDRYKTYTIDHSFIGSVKEETGRKILENLYRADQKRADVSKYLMKRYAWDFFLVVLVGIDRVQHFFWHCMEKNHPRYHEKGAELFRDAVFGMYEKMDRLVGELLEETGDDVNIIIMSDHGAGPFDDSVPYLNLNSWLADSGYLVLKEKKAIFRDSAEDTNTNLLKNLRQFLRSVLPPEMRQKIKSALPGLREKYHSHLYFSSIDWTKTLAYASYDEFMARGIRINLIGREPMGIVKPGKQYEDLREELAQRISEFMHPITQEPIVEQVFKREDLFRGPYVEKSPDIVVLWGENAFFSPGLGERRARQKKKESFPLTNISRSGEHRRNGILIMDGPDIRTGITIDDADIQDIAPTVLHLFDLPVTKGMDGKVLTQALSSSYMDHHPIRYGEDRDAPPRVAKTYSKAEEKIIKHRLKDLGYLE